MQPGETDILPAEAGRLLSEIMGRTDSELIFFFGLVILGLIVLIPFYRLRAKQDSERMAHEKDLEKERAGRESVRVREILTVVGANTEALHNLKSVIAALSARNDSAHSQLLESVERLREAR